MKKWVIAISVLMFAASALASVGGLMMSGGSGGGSGPTCSGNVGLVWEMDSSTADCSQGDASATATGTPTISAGVGNFTAGEYWSFDVSSDDNADDALGTVFIKGNATAFYAYSTLFNLDGGDTDTVSLEMRSSNELRLIYTGNGSSSYCETSGDALPTSTDLIIRIRWRQASSPYLEVAVFGDDETTFADGNRLDYAQNTTGATAFNEAPGSGDLQFGNTLGYGTGDFDVDWVEVHKDWRDAPTEH